MGWIGGQRKERMGEVEKALEDAQDFQCKCLLRSL
jgi:hypothetical protein